MDYSTVMMIKRDDFIELLKESEDEDFEKFCYLKDQILFNNNLEIVK